MSTHPKVEKKFPMVNFQKLVYPRLIHPVMEVKQKDVLFSLVHGIYKNRERLFQQKRTEDPLCPNQACRREGLVQNIEHMFCSCYKVRTAWQWIRRKIIELQTEVGPPLTVSNLEIILAMFPTCRFEVECIFMRGVYVELVDREVISNQMELLLNSLKGVINFKTENSRSRAVPQIKTIKHPTK